MPRPLPWPHRDATGDDDVLGPVEVGVGADLVLAGGGAVSVRLQEAAVAGVGVPQVHDVAGADRPVRGRGGTGEDVPDARTGTGGTLLGRRGQHVVQGPGLLLRAVGVPVGVEVPALVVVVGVLQVDLVAVLQLVRHRGHSLRSSDNTVLTRRAAAPLNHTGRLPLTRSWTGARLLRPEDSSHATSPVTALHCVDALRGAPRRAHACPGGLPRGALGTRSNASEMREDRLCRFHG
jgi:hypothetical protein